MNVMSLRLEEREIKLIEEMARKEGKDKSITIFPSPTIQNPFYFVKDFCPSIISFPTSQKKVIVISVSMAYMSFNSKDNRLQFKVFCR